MKWYVLLVIVLLSISFVSAELIISCERDDTCNLFLDDSWCEEDLCVVPQVEEDLEVRDELRDYNEVEWGMLVLEEKEEFFCENCLNFAPEYTGNLFYDFIYWLIYAK